MRGVPNLWFLNAAYSSLSSVFSSSTSSGPAAALATVAVFLPFCRLIRKQCERVDYLLTSVVAPPPLVGLPLRLVAPNLGLPYVVSPGAPPVFVAEALAASGYSGY